MKYSLLYGIHPVESAIHNDPEHIQQIWIDQHARNPRLLKLKQEAERKRLTIHTVSEQELFQQCRSQKHQGVVIAYQDRPLHQEGFLLECVAQVLENKKVPLLLALDGMTDPHNLGACLRTADSAGVHAVIIPKDKAVGITPVVRKVASGAAERIPVVRVTNLGRCLDALKQKGLWVTGTSDQATQSLYDIDFTVPSVIVIGSEGSGMRHSIMQRCDHLAAIPMLGTVSSLNASVASGVCLFEAIRQRQFT